VLRYTSITVDFDDSFGERMRGFLREIVPDAACDNPECIFAGEFFAIGSVDVQVWCTVGIAFKNDRRHVDDWTFSQFLFELIVF
jgi:hypothetical protein